MGYHEVLVSILVGLKYLCISVVMIVSSACAGFLLLQLMMKISGKGENFMWGVIGKALKEKNISQVELATLTGISTGTVSDLKSGRIKRPSFELLEKIADVLDIDMNDFRKKYKKD